MLLPTLLPDELQWPELDRRIMIVRTCFTEACGTISDESGVQRMIRNAKAAHELVTKSPGAKLTPDMGKAINVLWRLAQILQTLLERKIDLKHHLMMMVRGDPVFGRRDDPGKEFYKDFELELHIAAKLCEWTPRTVELHPPGHPFDITFGGKLRIDCKHPSSQGNKIARAIKEFGEALEEDGQEGAMVLSIEDALELDDVPVLGPDDDITAVVRSKFLPLLEKRRRGWGTNFEAYPRILGVFFMVSAPIFIDRGYTVESILYPLHAIGLGRKSATQAIDKLLQEFLIAVQH